jgi:alpha-tubulin suppressor-like RCC1 family protein
MRCRGAAAAALAVLSAGCIDKPTPTEAHGRTMLRLDVAPSFVQTASAPPASMTLSVAYAKRSGTSGPLASQTMQVAGGTQVVSLTVDLADCLRDSERAATAAVCPLIVSIALRDASSALLDSIQIGPFPAAPGGSQALNVGASFADTTTLASGDTLRLAGATGTLYTTSDTSVATVSLTGLVTSKGIGVATVTAIGPNGPSSVRVQVSPRPEFSLSANTNFTCALNSAGKAFCWGNNASGQLGTGSGTQSNSPAAVATNETFSQISASDINICALSARHEIWCWGQAGAALGAGTNNSSTTPVRVSGTERWQYVSAGNGFTCATGADSTAWCWGSNSRGQLGQSDTLAHNVPVHVTGGFHYKSVHSAGVSACGLDAAGTVHCWGSNAFLGLGQRGFSPSARAITPVPISGFTFQNLSSSFVHSCGVLTTGGAACWGGNFFGGLGNGTQSTNDTVPRILPNPGAAWRTFGLANANNIEVVSCGVTVNDDALCWGANNEGQMGAATAPPASCNSQAFGGAFSCSFQPVAVAPVAKFRFVAAGVTHSCGITTDHRFMCWGGNSKGEIGDGTTTQRASPVVVPGLRAP